ncbi:Dehydrogenase xptC [Pseudocercospora fuligena]|uniref:Dehydrogenase xptC n=1 Tax=Pseudocercospora fuligena TaxID=685502 RepID=A0A8H6VQ36_9PEZI|nr:Dehydrogenase xptC [Pseudocercospora fuligena]
MEWWTLAISLLLIPLSSALPSISDPKAFNHTYDYVIVGAGPAGLVVANRLSEDPEVTVLIVEYGYLDNNKSILVPYESVHSQPYANQYNITSAPMKNLGNKRHPVYVGATVGGGSVINGLYFNRGSKADYDAWEQLGNPGWGWNGLLPYFLKSTNFSSPEISPDWHPTFGADAWGADGPVHVSIVPFEWPQQKVFRDAFAEMEIPLINEANDGSQVGLGWVPNSVNPDTRTRSDARTAYHDSACARNNVQLLTGTKARRILFDNDKTAVGVDLTGRDHDWRVIVNASKEVIVAAGAIWSPNLLQISGIGPQEMLKNAGVPVVHDSPGVGLNFQDTPTVIMRFNLTTNLHPSGDNMNDPTFYQLAKHQYESQRNGPFLQGHPNNVAFLSLRQITREATSIVDSVSEQSQAPAEYLPGLYGQKATAGYKAQLEILTTLLSGNESSILEFPFPADSLPQLNLLQKPLSRGTITLNASDPDLGPYVDYNVLANPLDAEMLVAMIKWTRSFFETNSIRKLGPEELIPGPEVRSQEALIAALSKDSLLVPQSNHQTGTCSMMPEELGGVVGPDLLVYGVKHLSVVDSSIFPMLPAARLVSTVYAVAEKAADTIKSRSEV